MNDLILVSILEAMQKADGLIDNSGLCKLLQGRNCKKLRRNGLDHVSEFGALAHIEKSEILNHIDNLIERGCFKVGFFNLHITDLGIARVKKLEKKSVIDEPLPTETEEIEITETLVCDEKTFWQKFMSDIEQTKKQVVIVSPFISEYRIKIILPALVRIMSRNIQVMVYTRPHWRNSDRKIIRNLHSIGIDFVFIKRIHQKIAIIDDAIVWNGSLNIFQHIDSREQMVRHCDAKMIQEFHKLIEEIDKN